MRAGQEIDHRVARAAEVRGDQLGVLERRVAGPGPAGVVHVVDLRAAERVEAAELVQRLDLLLDGVGDLVLRQQLADAAVLAFGARAVVAQDVEDDRVVADAEAVELVDHLADLRVDVLDEAGEDLHQPPLERPLALPGCCPTRPWSSARGVSLVSAGIQPSSFWRLKMRSRSASQPSSNLPLYLSAHSLKMWCGPCAGAGRPVHAGTACRARRRDACAAR